MSYRVDIPTLSANEVYTLTFEYEGTETIQLIVGDLTLETTDRRVVFTTTSPVNHIESNVNLTNLNMYEGYYESDDFGGEYTQESYLSGKSLVNLCPTTEYVFPLDANTRRDFVTSCEYGKTYTIICKATFTDVSSLTRTPDIGFIDAPGGQWVSSLTEFDLKTGLVCSAVQISTDATKPYKVRTGFDGTINGIMVLEGDKTQEFLNGDFKIFSEGIGCVKSPKIVSIGNTQGFGKGGRL